MSRFGCNMLNYRLLFRTVVTFFLLKEVECAEYCVDNYATRTCEFGCCGNGCCYSKLSLALGLIFGLIGLALFSSGFAICIVQYIFKKKKSLTTRDAFVQTGDPGSGTVMKPTSIPPIFLKNKKAGKDLKKSDEVKLSMEQQNETS